MDSAWEAIFMLVILKIPLVYLCAVVWWAVRAEPTAGDDGDTADVLAPLTPCGWDDWKRHRGSPRLLPRSGRPNYGPARVHRARVGAPT